MRLLEWKLEHHQAAQVLSNEARAINPVPIFAAECPKSDSVCDDPHRAVRSRDLPSGVGRRKAVALSGDHDCRKLGGIVAIHARRGQFRQGHGAAGQHEGEACAREHALQGLGRTHGTAHSRSGHPLDGIRLDRNLQTALLAKLSQAFGKRLQKHSEVIHG